MQVNKIEERILIDKLLNKCKLLYKELQDKNDVEGIYGKAPEKAMITYGFGRKGKVGVTISDVVHKWIFENEELMEISVNEKPEIGLVDGMYYKIAQYNFSIDFEKRVVFLNYIYGPRFGRWLKIIIQGADENVSLGTEEIMGAS